MARSRATDFLSVSKFHLLDVSFTWPPVLIPIFGFKSITLPQMNIELKEIKQGNYEFPMKVVSKASVDNITLDQGVSLFNSDFYDWIKKSAVGQVSPRNLILIQFTNVNPKLMHVPTKGGGLPKGLASTANATSNVLSVASNALAGFGFEDGARLPGRAWTLQACRPIKYRPGSDFNATSSEISIASLTLAMEEFEEFSLGI